MKLEVVVQTIGQPAAGTTRGIPVDSHVISCHSRRNTHNATFNVRLHLDTQDVPGCVSGVLSWVRLYLITNAAKVHVRCFWCKYKTQCSCAKLSTLCQYRSECIYTLDEATDSWVIKDGVRAWVQQDRPFHRSRSCQL